MWHPFNDDGAILLTKHSRIVLTRDSRNVIYFRQEKHQGGVWIPYGETLMLLEREVKVQIHNE